MTIKITNITTKNNGRDGVRIEGDIDVEIDGLTAEGNGGQGLNIIKPQTILDQLGLPTDTDPALLAELLAKLKTANSIEEKEKTIVSSRLGQFLRKHGINITTITANLLSIAASNNVQ